MGEGDQYPWGMHMGLVEAINKDFWDKNKGSFLRENKTKQNITKKLSKLRFKKEFNQVIKNIPPSEEHSQPEVGYWGVMEKVNSHLSQPAPPPAVWTTSPNCWTLPISLTAQPGALY